MEPPGEQELLNSSVYKSVEMEKAETNENGKHFCR